MHLRQSCPFLGVVDSDTLRVEWEGQPRLLRLMDVDPERALPGGSVPATEFGRRTMQWLRGTVFEPVQDVTLEFPRDTPATSNSGKLLGYVSVAGENVNVRLVREGWSPCFDKYGHPRIYREEMERAELWARLEGRGVWGGCGGRGDYHALRAYWRLRAGQVDGCRHAAAMGEDILGCRNDYDEIAARARAGTQACIFSDLVRPFHMADGSVLIQLGNPRRPLAAFFPPQAAALAAFLERAFLGFGKPNYLYLTGTVTLAGEHPQISIEIPEQVGTCAPRTTEGG